MNKNNNLFDKICNAFLIYKFRWIIAIITIFLIIAGAVMFHNISKDLNKEPIEKGYSGFFDDVKYDDWTGEIIPKNEIYSYNNDNKYIINLKGERIYFYQIKEKINEYEKIQGQYGFIKEKDKETIDNICKKILNEYLDVEYEWNKTSDSHYEIYIENHDKYEAYIGATSDLRSFVAEKICEKYKMQKTSLTLE